MTISVLEKGIKPCQEMYAEEKDDHVNLMTHCDHPLCVPGCFLGNGDCEDYKEATVVSSLIKHVAGLCYIEED